MKQIFSLLFCLFFWQLCQAQSVISIAQARALPIGTSVTVRGVVTNGSELGVGLRYLQDGTAGIAGFSGAQLGGINRGDSIQITGVLKDYNNLLELDPVTNVQVLATNLPLPAPVEFTGTITPAFAEQFESQLVKLNNATSLTTTGGSPVSTFSGNVNYNLNNSAQTQLRVNIASSGPAGIVGKPAPTGGFNVTGIMSQFVPGTPNTTSGYQLIPRLYADFELSGGPSIIFAVTASQITTSGFTILFTTQDSGSTVVNYGPTPALGQTITNGQLTTAHSTTLSGLQPATVYYVQVSSTNASGTSTSPVIPFMTASLSSGDMKVYFNAPVDHSFAYPGNEAVFLNHSLDDTLIAYLNRANSTIDLAIYHWHQDSISNIAAALNAAHTRGVRVRVIMDALQNSTISNNGQTFLDSAIPVIARATSQGIMHNKFVIIDAESSNPDSAFVWAGSTNFTGTQINDDPNSVIIIQDQSLAKAYVMEFEEMWNSTSAVAGTPVWGAAKTSNTPQQFNIGGKQVELYFSPSDNVNSQLIGTIQSADHDFFFASMLITRTDVAAAINAKYQQSGLNLCSAGIINDTSFTGGYAYLPLKNVMADRVQLWNQPTIMHHKYLIIDTGDTLADPLTWISTHNWSSSATTNNDENTLVIHDANIANQYYQEFAARMQEIVPTLPLCNFSGINSTAATLSIADLQVYPNPAQKQFVVKSNDQETGPAHIRLFDSTGKLVHTQISSTSEAVIMVPGLPSGLYQLQVVQQGKSTALRVVLH